MKPTHSVLITGGTSGLGYHAALSIARSHPEYLIIICSRTDPDKAADRINRTLGRTSNNPSCIFLPLDLSSPAQIHTFVTKTLPSSSPVPNNQPQLPPIKILLLNAGLQFPGGLTTVPGHPGSGYPNMEATFAVNHAGHALLFHLLLLKGLLLSPSPSSSSPSEVEEEYCSVVVTASGTHDPAQNSGLPDALYISAQQLAYPKPGGTEPGEADYPNGRQRYATSKLANILWTYGVSSKISKTEEEKTKNMININAFDPGLMPGTGLARQAHPVLRFIWHVLMPKTIPLLRLLVHPNVHSVEESGGALADVALRAASASNKSEQRGGGGQGGKKKKERMTGKYFEGRKEIRSSVVSYDEEKQEDLWRWTVGFVEGVLVAEEGEGEGEGEAEEGGSIREKVERLLVE